MQTTRELGKRFLKPLAFPDSLADSETRDRSQLWEGLRRIFIKTSGWALLITSLLKLASALGHASILYENDFIFGIQNRLLLVLVGLMEAVISIYVLAGKSERIKLLSIVGLVNGFLCYRFFAWHLKAPTGCPCVGFLSDALPIPPFLVLILIDCLLVYLFIFGYILFIADYFREPSTANIA